MKKSRIKLGILGGGINSLVGILHRTGAAISGQYDLMGGVFNSAYKNNLNSARELGVSEERVYKHLDQLIAEESQLSKTERIQAVCVLTPNKLHFPMAKKLLDHGFHVICEKPLTTTSREAEILEQKALLQKKVFAVTYTYTGYPMVRQMRKMIRDGQLGKLQKVDLQYYQGWLNPVLRDENKSSWRLDPEIAGKSCCTADIGTHAFQMLEFVTNLRVKHLLADLGYLEKGNELDVDATVLLKCSETVKGIIRSSQIATGEENNFRVSIYGEKGALKWQQEDPNNLYFQKEGKPVEIWKRANHYNSELSLEASKLPPGHPEGIFDAMGNIYKGIAKAIKEEDYDSAEYPDIKDGVRGMHFIQKVLESHNRGNIWTQLPD